MNTAYYIRYIAHFVQGITTPLNGVSGGRTSLLVAHLGMSLPLAFPIADPKGSS